MWIAGVVGGVGIVTGTVLGIAALNEKADYDDNPTEASADRGERLALFADVSFGVGAMALITGAVLLLTYDDPGDAGAGDDTAVVVTPVLDAQGAGAAARVRF